MPFSHRMSPPRLSAFLLHLALLLLLLPRPSSPGPTINISFWPQLVEQPDVFDSDFLQKASAGQLPGVDSKLLLDMAYWFKTKSTPCCDRLLNQTGTRHRFNCSSLPEPTDHESSLFLHRMVFECIGEKRDVRECCRAWGVRSSKCLNLCDSAHPLDPDAFEKDNGGQQMMQKCAAELDMPGEQFLWKMFDCMNPQFSKVMRLTQMVKAENALKQKQNGEKEKGEYH